MEATWKPSFGIVFSKEGTSAVARASNGAAQNVAPSSVQMKRHQHLIFNHSTSRPIYEIQNTVETEKIGLKAYREQLDTQNLGPSAAKARRLSGGETGEVSALEEPHRSKSTQHRAVPRLASVGSCRATPAASGPVETGTVPRYRIPEETLILAKRPGEGLKKYWGFTLYKSPEGKPPTAHYCTKPESFERIAKLFEDEKLLGFDLEWRPNARSSEPWWHNVAVLQLASQEHIGIFHFAHAAQKFIKERSTTPSETHESQPFVSPCDVVPMTLRKILESAATIKAGVNIGSDRTRLESHCGIQMKSTFELSHLFKLVKHSPSKEYHLINRRIVTLSEQVNEHLLLPMDKGQVRLSDWSTGRLNKQQINYSASDAYASLMLYLEMDLKRQSLRPVPPLPRFDELKQPIVVAKYTEPASEEAICTSLKPGESNPASQSGLSSKDQSGGMKSPFVSVPDDHLLQEAQKYVQQWQNKSESGRPEGLTAAVLRSYFLWHHRSLAPDKICSVLRSPPLQASTVTRFLREIAAGSQVDVEMVSPSPV